MNYLLDTNAVIFYCEGSARLRKQTYDMLQAPEANMFVSAATAAELACLQSNNRIQLDSHWKPWFRRKIEINGWRCLDITLEILEEAYSLPEPFHRDPADRILVATARLEKLTIVTADSLILRYPHVEAIG